MDHSLAQRVLGLLSCPQDLLRVIESERFISTSTAGDDGQLSPVGKLHRPAAGLEVSAGSVEEAGGAHHHHHHYHHQAKAGTNSIRMSGSGARAAGSDECVGMMRPSNGAAPLQATAAPAAANQARQTGPPAAAAIYRVADDEFGDSTDDDLPSPQQQQQGMSSPGSAPRALPPLQHTTSMLVQPAARMSPAGPPLQKTQSWTLGPVRAGGPLPVTWTKPMPGGGLAPVPEAPAVKAVPSPPASERVPSRRVMPTPPVLTSVLGADALSSPLPTSVGMASYGGGQQVLGNGKTPATNYLLNDTPSPDRVSDFPAMMLDDLDSPASAGSSSGGSGARKSLQASAPGLRDSWQGRQRQGRATYGGAIECGHVMPPPLAEEAGRVFSGSDEQRDAVGGSHAAFGSSHPSNYKNGLMAGPSTTAKTSLVAGGRRVMSENGQDSGTAALRVQASLERAPKHGSGILAAAGIAPAAGRAWGL